MEVIVAYLTVREDRAGPFYQFHDGTSAGTIYRYSNIFSYSILPSTEENKWDRGGTSKCIGHLATLDW